MWRRTSLLLALLLVAVAFISTASIAFHDANSRGDDSASSRPSAGAEPVRCEGRIEAEFTAVPSSQVCGYAVAVMNESSSSDAARTPSHAAPVSIGASTLLTKIHVLRI